VAGAAVGTSSPQPLWHACIAVWARLFCAMDGLKAAFSSLEDGILGIPIENVIG
jgi:hypothetical protein